MNDIKVMNHAADNIRILAASMVEKAKSGHPGGAMGGADFVNVLYSEYLQYDPENPKWEGRMFNTALKVSYDYALFLELSLICDFYAVNQPVFLRRRHATNMSNANYRKMLTVLQIVEKFADSHTEIKELYGKVLKSRLADLHSKLHREAKKEKLFSDAKNHAKLAYKLKPTLKNFCRLLGL